jgi:hypothetical protein
MSRRIAGLVLFGAVAVATPLGPPPLDVLIRRSQAIVLAKVAAPPQNQGDPYQIRVLQALKGDIAAGALTEVRSIADVHTTDPAARIAAAEAASSHVLLFLEKRDGYRTLFWYDLTSDYEGAAEGTTPPSVAETLALVAFLIDCEPLRGDSDRLVQAWVRGLRSGNARVMAYLLENLPDPDRRAFPPDPDGPERDLDAGAWDALLGATVQVIEAPEPRTAPHALRALRTRWEKARPAVRARASARAAVLARDPEPDIACEALLLLARAGDARALAESSAWLRDRDSAAKVKTALEVLRSRADRDVLARDAALARSLVVLLDDPDHGADVMKTLEALAGDTAERDVTAWRKWLAKQAGS